MDASNKTRALVRVARVQVLSLVLLREWVDRFVANALLLERGCDVLAVVVRNAVAVAMVLLEARVVALRVAHALVAASLHADLRTQALDLAA